MWRVVAAGIAVPIGAKLVLKYYVAGHYKIREDLSDKIFIITGASGGIGQETAHKVARHGAKVIMAVRDIEKGHRAAKHVIEKTGNRRIEVRHLDVADLSSVKQFAEEFLKSGDQLDVLVLNAGIIGPAEKQVTRDKLELTWATNHFGHFLLTNLLLDRMKQSGAGRIIVVSSRVHKSGKVDPDDVNYEKRPYPGSWQAYADTKLANILFTKGLARRLEGTTVTINAYHPGLVSTELFRSQNLFMSALFRLVSPMLKTPIEGAQTAAYLAVAKEARNYNGQYFADCKLATVAPAATDDALSEKLWSVSERLTGCKPLPSPYKQK